MTGQSQDELRAAMEPKWILRKGEVEASFSIDRLRLHARAGRLRRDDMVRREDQPEWRRAGDVREVFPPKYTWLTSVATAVILSILLVGLVRTIVPDMRPGTHPDTRPKLHMFVLAPLVCGIFNGGILVGYDQAQGWGMAMPMVQIMMSRTRQWIPWVWCQQIRPLAVVYLFVPLWIPSTVLLSIPALLRPHRFAPGALLRRFVDFLRLSPRA